MSGGILGNFFSPEGTGGGLLGNLSNAITNNGDSMMGLGLGLMSGDMSTAMQGYAAGNRTDTARRQHKLLQDQELQKRTAAQSIAQQLGLDPRLAQGDPDTVLALYKQVQANKLIPKEQSFNEKLFNQLPEDQRGAARDSLLGITKAPKWELKTIKGQDGAPDSAVYFNSADPTKTFPVPGYGAPTGPSKSEVARNEQVKAADIVVQDIDRALDLTKNAWVPTTGTIGQAAQHVGGTNAKDVSSLVDTIKANATFDKLQQMRKSSPTGAALGAVSDTENRLLGAAIGSLDQSQSREQFERNMKRVKKIYNEIIHGPGTTDGEGNLTKSGGAQGAVQGGSDRSALEAEARRRGLLK